jgi:sarcosine oxidase, subunit gamma
MSEVSSGPIMQSPLHGFGLEAQSRPIDDSNGVWANEVPLLGYISLRGTATDTAFTAAASQALGLRLPTEPCSMTQNGAAKILWLSPDEWMIACPRDRHPTLLKDLTTALTGIPHQIADNSGGYTQVIIKGRNAGHALSHCTVYDIDALAAGRVVGTTFGKSSVYLHRAGDGYCLLLRRSFADYIWRTLARAALPYGLGIAKFGPGHLGAAA